MHTRLITTYEEAIELRKAGFEQEDPKRSPADQTFWMVVEGNPVCTVNGADRFMDIEYVRACRLDELLAFLWERGLHMTFSHQYDECGELESTLEVMDSFAHRDVYAAPLSDEIVSSVCAAVLHVLNNERPLA